MLLCKKLEDNRFEVLDRTYPNYAAMEAELNKHPERFEAGTFFLVTPSKVMTVEIETVPKARITTAHLFNEPEARKTTPSKKGKAE